MKLTALLKKATGHAFTEVSVETERELAITIRNPTPAALQALQLLKTFDDLMLLLDEARIRSAISMRDYNKTVKRAQWHMRNWLRSCDWLLQLVHKNLKNRQEDPYSRNPIRP